MATKNLARTVLEAGRSNWSQFGRRRLRRLERQEARRFCYSAKYLEDLDDLESAPVRRPKDYSFGQDDKLGPLYCWLDAHYGQPWNDIWSKLMPLRQGGIAISHVVDVHIVGVIEFPGENYRWSLYYVEDGILQKRRQPPRPRGSWRKTYLAQEAVREYAAGRKILKVGKKLYWTRPDTIYNYFGDPIKVSHRQGRELSPEEYAMDIPEDLYHGYPGGPVSWKSMTPSI